MNNRGEIRRVNATVTLSGNVEWETRVFGETRVEELKECIDILTSNRTVIHRGAIVGVRKADVHRLVKEDDVGMCIPTVWVESRVAALIGDVARPQFKEKSSG